MATEDKFRNIKSDIFGKIKNISIEDLCNSLSVINKEILIDSYNISSEYKNKKNKIDIRKQNIIIISHKETIKYLNNKNGVQYGFDLTYN